MMRKVSGSKKKKGTSTSAALVCYEFGGNEGRGEEDVSVRCLSMVDELIGVATNIKDENGEKDGGLYLIVGINEYEQVLDQVRCIYMYIFVLLLYA